MVARIFLLFFCRGADICKTKPSSHTLTADEEALLKADTVHLVSEINKGELQARVSAIFLFVLLFTY